MNIEGWDSEVTLKRHRPPAECQKYFFLDNFRRFSEFLVKISLFQNVKNFQNGCRFVILAIFQKCNILVFKPYTNIGHTTGYILSFWVVL